MIASKKLEHFDPFSVHLADVVVRGNVQISTQARALCSIAGFEWAGIGAAHVRATVFYENLRALAAWSLSKDGTMLLPWGSDETVLPLVSSEDVAHVAAAVLTSTELQPGSSHPVIGEVLRLRDIVATFGRVLERDVRYHEIPDQLWHDAALARGFNQHAVEHLSHLWRTLRAGASRFEVPDTIEKLVGRKPKTFEEFVRDERSAFSAAA